ncbi:hypothetical protein FQR65_LT12072 [Abscondita terminalis]|nr:hypothetical protein FQR65_LT12072 [Abscondita terminalis]
MAQSLQQKERKNYTFKNKRVDTTYHNLKKRASCKTDINESILYVSSKSNIKGLLEKCDKLIKGDEKEIVINCMGAAIQRGIVLALQICEKHIAFQISSNTSTVELIALKFDHNSNVYQYSWWTVFCPLFASDALNAYFCIIVFIRMHLESSLKAALQRLAWSGNFIFMIFLFKFLLCKKLMGQWNLDYSEIFAPIYILLQLVAVRACQQT